MTHDGNHEPAFSIPTEFPFDWFKAMDFEFERPRGQGFDWPDPYEALKNLPWLLKQANEEHDPGAAYKLFDLALCCSEQAERPIPPGIQPLDCSPVNAWSVEERAAWMRLAARGGYTTAALATLSAAEKSNAPLEMRREMTKDAAIGLEISASRGSLEAALALATLLRDGDLIEADLPRSYAYFQVAAAATSADAYSRHAGSVRERLKSSDLAIARSIQEKLAAALAANGRCNR
ncbi:hypothetical protein [Mitsuaria sp. GD03876]|uniref:hypothetical protein n=1 Tax=Mitsuaria sp. GD03876 TaxID=2975399 RepID=UPI00244D1B44|nr:hypothetical protein [Mitsuaria sp. GD03876]MDH0865568.1 hypothetical protein [Mitsuaria sp. GD03876]